LKVNLTARVVLHTADAKVESKASLQESHLGFLKNSKRQAASGGL
jgi:hypothetical protein